MAKVVDKETSALCQSEIACDISDAYVEMDRHRYGTRPHVEAQLLLVVNLQRLERATRTSQLRKIRT